MRLPSVCAALLLCAGANAHDLITAESAQRYLDNAVRWQQQSVLAADPAQRALSHLKLGRMLDEIRELLNRDLAVHGQVQGLASNYLVAELKRTGTPLAVSRRSGYFLANSSHYRRALELGLERHLVTEAQLHLLRGEFYDSFGVDPLQTTQTDEQLQEQLVLADALIASIAAEPRLEEVRFIAAIVYARAARAATDRPARLAYRDNALELADAFERDYPDSLRSAAIPVVRDALRELE